MNIRVLGLGNVLMSDDGFGPYVARVLDAFYEVSDAVDVVDAGAPGRDLAPYLLNADVIILVDTVASPGKPGDIVTCHLEEILKNPTQARLCPHDPGISEALRTVAAAGGGPRQVLLIGVVPEWVATGVDLSPSVRSAIAPVVSLVVTELERLGQPASLRAVPRQPDTWWERAADAVSA